MKNDCKIVEDLLPNYLEKVTSIETNDYIEKHLEGCKKCSEIYTNMKENVKLDDLDVDREVDYMKKFNKKIKNLNLWKKMLFIILALIILALGFAIYRYTILTKIYLYNSKINALDNIYYREESSNYPNSYTEHWKKDGVIKQIEHKYTEKR